MDEDTLVAAGTKLISNARKSPALSFNPFITCGFDPIEDRFSDAIAEILSPDRNAGLGLIPLLALLDAVEPQCNVRAVREHYQGTRCALEAAEPNDIRVRRNAYRPKAGRPDIEIVSLTKCPFMIVIENKKRLGSETMVRDIHQTLRYSQSNEREANRLGIPLTSTLGIFLTPEGKSARSAHFVSLSCGELAAALLAAASRATHSDPNCLMLYRAFLATYAWLNGG